MKKLNITTLLCGLILFINSCGGSDNKTDDGSTTAKSIDEVETTAKSVAEGEVAIGNQIWTSKNLDVETYRNGDAIPQVIDEDVWNKLTTGAWCYYANNPTNGTVYGKLYNCYAVNDPRGLAPKGYHIPTDAEWTILTDYLSGGKLEGEDSFDRAMVGICGNKMRSKNGWQNAPDGNGTNSSGFNGLPGGYLTRHGFSLVRERGYWWSSSITLEFKTDSYYRNLIYGYVGIQRGYYSHKIGMSVRCIRD